MYFLLVGCVCSSSLGLGLGEEPSMSVAGPERNVVHKDNSSETYRCSASYGETVKPEQSATPCTSCRTQDGVSRPRVVSVMQNPARLPR